MKRPWRKLRAEVEPVGIFLMFYFAAAAVAAVAFIPGNARW